jgi:Zn-finger nucleic acid-binding protein
MRCPRCATIDLQLADRQGVEIDVCPGCRGVWLDRGELEKLIERSYAAPYADGGGHDEHGPPSSDRRGFHGHGDHGHGDRQYGDGHDRHQGKRRSWLSDLFD